MGKWQLWHLRGNYYITFGTALYTGSVVAAGTYEAMEAVRRLMEGKCHEASK